MHHPLVQYVTNHHPRQDWFQHISISNYTEHRPLGSQQEAHWAKQLLTGTPINLKRHAFLQHKFFRNRWYTLTNSTLIDLNVHHHRHTISHSSSTAAAEQQQTV
jgi:hypothetical protein